MRRLTSVDRSTRDLVGTRGFRRAGFTIIEMLAVMSIIGFLAGIGIPKLHNTLKVANNARAIGDIGAIQTDLEAIEASSTPLPATLAAIGRGTMLDPWGN
ncbi:MAG: prepilin-type N-terminal cleavage/methylation domain-containing protein, partial [Gemmatimonadota bacterium]